MKKLIIAISLLTFQAFALEVKSVAGGSCWVQELEDSIKIASFNNSLSTNLSNPILGQLIGEVSSKDQLVGPSGNNQFFVHCGSFGARLVMNLESKQGRVCVWANFDESGIESHEVGYLKKSELGACDGYLKNEFLLGLTSDENRREEVLKHLVQKYQYDFKLIALTKTLYKVVRVNESFDIEEISNIYGVKYIERVIINHPVGEFHLLENLSTQVF